MQKKISVGKKKLNKPATNGRKVDDQSTININEISKVDFVDTHGNKSDDGEIYTEISICRNIHQNKLKRCFYFYSKHFPQINIYKISSEE